MDITVTVKWNGHVKGANLCSRIVFVEYMAAVLKSFKSNVT